MNVGSCAGLPGVLFYWQFRILLPNGISFQLGGNLLGEDVAAGFEKLISASLESLK